jgi:hypothetical protein
VETKQRFIFFLLKAAAESCKIKNRLTVVLKIATILERIKVKLNISNNLKKSMLKKKDYYN